MRTARPNLFIIGAMKAATTSLHYYLGSHPDIFMCEPKEPGWLVPELRDGRDIDWYLGLFRAAGAARWRGESSTHYTKLPLYTGVPERLHQLSPDARLIYVMRDPIERMLSHYYFNLRMGVDGSDQRFARERRDLADALRGDPAYLAFGDYAMQLRPWFARFGRERVLTLTSEQLIADPRATLGEIARWLDVAPQFSTELTSHRFNQRPGSFDRLRGFGLLNRLRHTRAWGRIAPRVPAPLRRMASRLACAPAERDPGQVAAAVASVLPAVQCQVLELERLLGRDFPEWRTLAAASPGAPAQIAQAGA